MTKVICSIYDAKAEYWMDPLYFMARGQAMRVFEDAVNGEGEISKHPEDYTLFAIGEWDESEGFIEPYEASVALEKGINLKRENV